MGFLDNDRIKEAKVPKSFPETSVTLMFDIINLLSVKKVIGQFYI